MAVLDIAVYPAKVLETRAAEVETFDDSLREFVQDMFQTMTAASGIGLAANQVSRLWRVIVMHIPWSGSRYDDQKDDEEEQRWWHDKNFVFINPVVTKKQGKQRFREGCLSFPDIYENVDRAAEVTVRAWDENGKPFEVEADGLFAICLQHEIDHLDGIVFINRMSRLKANLVRRKLERRGQVECPEDIEA